MDQRKTDKHISFVYYKTVFQDLFDYSVFSMTIVHTIPNGWIRYIFPIKNKWFLLPVVNWLQSILPKCPFNKIGTCISLKLYTNVSYESLNVCEFHALLITRNVEGWTVLGEYEQSSNEHPSPFHAGVHTHSCGWYRLARSLVYISPWLAQLILG